MLISELLGAVLLTSITGGICTLIWDRMRNPLQKEGVVWLERGMWLAVTVAWILPLAYLLVLGLNEGWQWRWSGKLFIPTPFWIMFSQVVLTIWFVGIVIGLLRFVLKNLRLQRLLAFAEDHPDLKLQELFRRLCEEKGVKKVRLLRLTGLETPFTVGLWRRAVVLSEKKLKLSDAEIVLLHELVHIQNRDVMRKQLAHLIVILHWFHPIVKRYREHVDFACECICDLTVCMEIRSMRRYYETVAHVMLKEPEEYDLSATALAKSDEELVRRISYVKGTYKMKGKATRRATALIVAAAVLLTSGGVSAASLAAVDGYMALSSLTEEKALDTEQQQTNVQTDEMAELGKWTMPGEELLIGETTELASDTGEFSWSIASGCTVTTSKLYLHKDDTIMICVTVSPSTKKVELGLVQPNGYILYVTGTGTLVYTHTLTQTGFYKVYVENLSSTKISVSGAYLVH